MLNEFFTWWSETLREMLPASLSGGAAAGPDALVVEPQGPGTGRVALFTRRGRTERPLGTFDSAAAIPVRPRAGATVLRLPPGTVLGRDLQLPLAAERHVAQTVEYEIDRLTPFSPAELHWTCALRHKDRARGRLHLRLSLVPRAALEPLLAALGRSGIVPGLLETTGDDGSPVRIDLRGARPAPARLSRLLDRGLLGACAALAMAVVATPFILQQIDLARAEKRIAALRPEVDAAEALRRRIASAASGVDVVQAARLRLGDTLAVLAAVTAVLPDDTSLSDLSLRGGRLTFGGQSGAAARLIPALAAEPLFRNPDFAAPVTRVQDGKADLFSIRAEVVP